jgi:hypothetical protein
VSLIGLAVGTLGGTAFTIGTFAVTWGTIAFGAASLLYGNAVQKKQEQRANDAQRNAQAQAEAARVAGLKDRTVSSVTTEQAYRYVYGNDRVGGTIVAILTSGARDEYKHVVAVLAQQESESIGEVYLNKVAVGLLDANGDATGGQFFKTRTESFTQNFFSVPFVLNATPISGTLSIVGVELVPNINGNFESRSVSLSYTLVGNTITAIDTAGLMVEPDYIASYQSQFGDSMIRIKKHLGADNQPVDFDLYNELGPAVWPLSAQLRGQTYVYIRFNLNQAEFQGGLIPIEVDLTGKKLYDPRTGLTAWSENPALVAYDYLSSELGGVPASVLPLAGFISAANDCDDIVSTPDGAWTGKRYTFNGTIDSDEGQEQVLEVIAQSMAGGIVATTWDIYAGKYRAPVMAVSQSDIVGEFAVSPGLPLNNIYNTVKGQYVGPENNYIINDYQPYQNDTYLDADGQELATNINLPYTSTQQRCTNLARVFMEDNRNGFSMTGLFSLKLFGVKPGDRIAFTSPFFGQDSKIFRMTDKAFGAGQFVRCGFKEDSPEIYDLADATVIDQTPNTNLPNPFDIDDIQSLTLESGDDQLLIQDDGTIVSRILAVWPQSTSPGIIQNGQIEIQYQAVGATEWQSAPILPGDATEAYLTPVEDGTFYSVRIRATNPYLNVSSDWTYAALHQVIGKTEPPPDVLNFTALDNTFTWSPVVAKDLAGYELRFNYGQNTTWGVATPLHIGIVTESPWTPENYPSGAVTVLIKAQDTTGNQSENVAAIFTNLGDPIVENLIETYDDKAAGFPGVKVNGTVVSGDLLADDSGDLFWGDDGASFYGEDGALFWPPSTYLQMTYTTTYTVDANEVGSRLTLLTDIEAASYTIQYRFGTQGLFWGADDAFFWGDDAALFWPAATEWQTWPGAIENLPAGEIEIRIITESGSVRGAIRELTLQFDVEDETEFLNDVNIAPGGTRLVLTKSYRSIKNILMTSQAVGGNTPIPIVLDKNVGLGPLVATYTSLVGGTSVAGKIDAQIQGVKGL